MSNIFYGEDGKVYARVEVGNLQFDEDGRLKVNVEGITLEGAQITVDEVTLAAGSAIVGQVGIDQTTPGVTNAVVLTGSYVTEQQIANNVTITAGASTFINSPTPIDLSSAEYYRLAVIPSATHVWSATGQRRSMGSVVYDGSLTDREQIFPSASRGSRISDEFKVAAPRMAVYMSNGDAADRTYSVYIIRLGVKVV